MKSLRIGEAASPAVVARICAAIKSSDLVLGVIHLRTEHLGPDGLLVGAKVGFDTDLDVFALAQAIDEVACSNPPPGRTKEEKPDGAARRLAGAGRDRSRLFAHVQSHPGSVVA